MGIVGPRTEYKITREQARQILNLITGLEKQNKDGYGRVGIARGFKGQYEKQALENRVLIKEWLLKIVFPRNTEEKREREK
jgi:hypothetical protein